MIHDIVMLVAVILAYPDIRRKRHEGKHSILQLPKELGLN